MNANYLAVSWATSRARDTYGYNICRLDDANTGKRYSTCGGNYDMLGTVFGEWLQDTHQHALMTIADRAYRIGRTAGDWTTNDAGMYGMAYYAYARAGDGHVVLDGGCGVESMRKIASAIGVETRATVNRKGNVTGYVVGVDES